MIVQIEDHQEDLEIKLRRNQGRYLIKREEQMPEKWKFNHRLLISVQIIVNIQLIRSSSCDDFITFRKCEDHKACNWNIFEEACENLIQNCDMLGELDCKFTPGCMHLEGERGLCDQREKLQCEDLGKNECERASARCEWTSILECENSSSGFGCDNLGNQNCLKNFEFCAPVEKCEDMDASGCSILSKEGCKLASTGCEYTQIQSESCQDRPKYCDSLSVNACQNETDVCEFMESSPFNCIDRRDSLICQSKSPQQCIQESRFCNYISMQCTNRVNCTSIKYEDLCGASIGCLWDTMRGLCLTWIICSDLTSEQMCLANANVCEHSSYLCTNKNQFGCSDMTRQECSLFSDYCLYTPAQGVCSSKLLCPQLSGQECQFLQAKCFFTPGIGFCGIKADLGCSSYSRFTCLQQSYCKLSFSNCINIQSDRCSLLSSKQCSSYPQCTQSHQGYCSDRLILCPQNKQECLLAQDTCKWTEEQKPKCISSLNCSEFSPSKCTLFSHICKLVQRGLCQSIIQLNINLSYTLTSILSFLLIQLLIL